MNYLILCAFLSLAFFACSHGGNESNQNKGKESSPNKKKISEIEENKDSLEKDSLIPEKDTLKSIGIGTPLSEQELKELKEKAEKMDNSDNNMDSDSSNDSSKQEKENPLSSLDPNLPNSQPSSMKTIGIGMPVSEQELKELKEEADSLDHKEDKTTDSNKG